MISQIGLTNFKCFKGEHNFPLSRFNLLTGINGRGKSTFLQSLLLMKQTTDYDRGSHYIILNGSCINLGNFEDIKNSFASNDDEIKFIFKIIDNPFIDEIHYTFGQDNDDESIAIVNEFSQRSYIDGSYETKVLKHYENFDYYYYLKLGDEILPENEGEYAFENASEFYFENLIPTDNKDIDDDIFRCIQFISADRIGPKNYYEIQNIRKDFSWVGAKGENTASVLLKKSENEVDDTLYLGEDTNTLLQQTEEWLNFIFDGAKININTEGGVVLISYNTKQGRERYKPSNVGFGYSYILPTVVAGLIAQSGEILIIENPEAHLHPRAQHKLTQFLAKVAATGVQIFVESHSEHILNALRICTIEQEGQEKILNNTDLSILYFQDNLTTPFIHIPIDEKGGIDEWPEGFFDQTDKDFKILFGF
jgi:predicted ATPase